MQVVYGTMPTRGGVDLDHCAVLPLAMLIDDAEVYNSAELVDRVIDGGAVILVDETSEHVIHWGKTSVMGGYYDVIVDVDVITLPILQALWLQGVIDGEYPGVM